MGSLSQYHVALDGSNEYISIGNVAALDFDRLTAFSISAWVYLTGTTGMYMIFAKMEASTTYRGWGLSVDNRRLQIQHVNDWGGANRLSVMTTSAVVSSNGWHHVVATMDGTGTAAGVKLYVDGTEITSKTTTYDTLSATTVGTGDATIGRRGSAGDLYFPGLVDEVAAYNIALSGAQVTTIYNDYDPPELTVTGPTGNLVGYWKIGDGDTYPTATDYASSNNGTYTNTEAADIEFGGGGEQVISASSGFSYAAMGSGQWYFIEGGFNFFETGVSGGSGGPGIITYYKMRAKDSLAGYVTWIATTPDFAGAGYSGGYPTPVGSMVVGSAVVATEWQI